jgi:hypothetical protein
MSKVDERTVPHIYGTRKGVGIAAHAFFRVQGRRAASGV